MLSIIITWSKRRRSFTRRFGVLRIDESVITLLDRDGADLSRGSGPEFTIEKVGRTGVGVTGPDGTTRYIVGPDTQLIRQVKVRRLVADYQAVLKPSPTPFLPEATYRRIVGGGTIYDVGTKALAQHLMWQPLLLALFWEQHATPKPGRPAG